MPFPALAERFAVLLSGGGEVCYYGRALGGASLYLGATPEDFQNICLETVSNPSASVAAPNPARKLAGKGFFLWLDYEISAMAYNALLQGAWSGSNAQRYAPADIAPIVHKINAGRSAGNARDQTAQQQRSSNAAA